VVSKTRIWARSRATSSARRKGFTDIVVGAARRARRPTTFLGVGGGDQQDRDAHAAVAQLGAERDGFGHRAEIDQHGVVKVAAAGQDVERRGVDPAMPCGEAAGGFERQGGGRCVGAVAV
jgi:hypothetical protein